MSLARVRGTLIALASSVNADLHRRQELVAKDFAGVHRRQPTAECSWCRPSMIVDDLNVPVFAIAPDKTDRPLMLMRNAALTLAIAVQSLQTIAGRHTQIVELLCRVDRKQLRAGAPLNLCQ